MNKLFHNFTNFVVVALLLVSPGQVVFNIDNSHQSAPVAQNGVPGSSKGIYDVGHGLEQEAAVAPAPLAFPGAEGFGANSLGGRGGKIMEVVNLNDSGTGSLRACVEASGARTCVFRTGGLITLKSTLEVKNPYITIAGQTAPGGGITLKTNGSGGDTLSISTHDVIVRYLTFRPGPGGENHGSQIASNGVALYNIVIDHDTFSWGTDSDIETWYRVYNSSIEWSIVSEGLDCSTHSKGCHSKGLMIGGFAGSESYNTKGSENVSVLHNLMAHNVDRNPLMQLCGIAQVVNNVTYDPQVTFSHQQNNCPGYTSYINWIGNYHKKGPSSDSDTDLKVIPADSGTMYAGKVYVQGNIGPSRPNTSQPDSNWVDSGSRSFIVTTPAAAPAVTTTDAQTAYNDVLAGAGNNLGLACDGTSFNRRDAIDTRIVNDVKNGTGHIINDPSEVGGWITPAAGTACTDTDHDGMPDVWEVKNGLNPNDPADANADADGDGYTNVEEYLDGAVITINTLNISGNAGVAGATLAYTDGTSRKATADQSGNYSFAISPNWSGTVTPSLACYTFSPVNRSYTSVSTSQTAQDYATTVDSACANINVSIAGNSKGTYLTPPQGSMRMNYTGVNTGPVKVTSTNGKPIIAAIRDAWVSNGKTTSFAQLMGLPAGQLSDTYLFPAYNNVTLDEQLRIGNVDSVSSTVKVTIGGVLRGTYTLPANGTVRVNYAGLDSGPVIVQGTSGVQIIAAIRDAWKVSGRITSSAQLMGLPAGQLSDTYLFPAYNNVTLNEQLRIGNVDSVPTTVTVTIGGVLQGTYPLGPNESTRVNYAGLDSGPVIVQGTPGVNIIAAIRDSWKANGTTTCFVQLMGLPAGQLSDTYLFPAYNNITLNEQLRIGNVDSVPSTVKVTIGGVLKGTYPLGPNESTRVNYAGVDSGPVVVQGTSGVHIIAAIRDSWASNGLTSSFVQLMGLPADQLSDTFLFPAYDNVTLNEQLRFGVP